MSAISLILFGLLRNDINKDNLTYKIEVTKDTVYIGEPIMLKCWLINKSNKEITILGYGYPDLIVYEYIALYLQTPMNNNEYRYGVFMHADLAQEPRKFLLAPKDSVYFYAILSWDGHYGGHYTYLTHYLTYDKLKAGYYKIRASYYFALESNVDSFYADTMPIGEKEIFEQTVPILDEFWGWPEETRPETDLKILEIFPGVIKKNSLLAPFCHYILWLKSWGDESRAESLADEFFKKYPNSPLAEKLAFDLYRYYVWRKKDIEKGKAIVSEALRKYSDNLQGYRYLGLRSKKERPK